MTKVTVFGEQESKAEKKPIELLHLVSVVGMDITLASDKVGFYDNVCLLGKTYRKYDFIMCWNNDDSHKEVYLGHWNDGVIA